MKYSRILLAAAAVILLTVPAAHSQSQTGVGQAIVTILPPHNAEHHFAVSPQDVRMLKFNGKNAQVTSFTSAGDRPVELIILVDPAARVSLGTQMGAFKHFVQEIPSNTKMAFAYMEEGRALLSAPLSSDPQQILREIQVPNGPPGIAASPYFCISDLARNWPSRDPNARRVVVLVSDGIDDYYVHYNPEDPYVLAAIHDSIRGGLMIYPFYWKDQTFLDQFEWPQMAGQNLMKEISDATGGYSYWEGFGNPVSFTPFFNNLRERLANQYHLTFTAPFRGRSQVGNLRIKLTVLGAKTVDAPQQVAVYPTGPASR